MKTYFGTPASCLGAAGRAKKIDRPGRLSITKTERPRSANLLQMPRGLMCKLRQRGRDYGGHRPAGSPGIDPSLQPLPLRSNCWGRPLWTGGIPATRPRIQAKRQFRPRLSGFQHSVLRCSLACFAFASGLFRPAPRVAHERCEREAETSARAWRFA